MISSLSLPASDPYRASDPAVPASRLNWHCPAPSYHDPVAGHMAPATNHDLIQLPVGDNASLGTSYELVQPAVSRLPAEVIDEIFSYARIPTLARLALVCHTFQGVATRLLYRHIPSLSLSLTTRCLETLASNPYLAAHIRTCEIGDATLADASRKGLLPPSFYEQLRRALHNMHRLTELTFLLNGSTSHVLPGAPFRLTKLTASCDFDATFASWLTEQSGLHSAIFCGNFTPGVTLPADSLPLLQRVAAAPLVLSCVLPGRPVREVELCLVHPWSLNREVLQMAMRIIAFSNTPLDSLKIITHLSEPPETVLSALEAIPTGLNSITKLALHAVSGSITDDIISGLPPILAQFSGLRSLTLFSKNRSDAMHTVPDPRVLAAGWHTTCASLESVTLGGATYVHNRGRGWVTLHDLAELLAAREQSLQQCAAEMCKHGAALEEGRRNGLPPSELGVAQKGGASVVAITA